jgi:hypothetical protein
MVQVEQKEDVMKRDPEWPDGAPHEWWEGQWYRHIKDGQMQWIFSGTTPDDADREWLCRAKVVDTGSRFRWEVELISGATWDAGYLSTLAAAQVKAEQAYTHCRNVCAEKAL